MTFNEFVKKWIGKKADWDKKFDGQCVDLFRFYCHEVLGIDQPMGVVGAADFWTNFPKDPILNQNFDQIPNTLEFEPVEGDVVIWNKNAGGGFGHIAIATGKNQGLQFFESFDQNWSKVSYCELFNHSYKNVLGVLRPKGGSMPSDKMEIDKQTFEKLVGNSGKWDGTHAELGLEGDPSNTPLDSAVNVIRGYKSQATDMRNKLTAAEQEIKNRQEQISRLKSDLLNEQQLRKNESAALVDAQKSVTKLQVEYQRQLDDLRAMVDDLSKNKGELLNQIAVLEVKLSEAKKGVTTPLSLFDVVKLIIPKLINWLKGVVLK